MYSAWRFLTSVIKVANPNTLWSLSSRLIIGKVVSVRNPLRGLGG